MLRKISFTSSILFLFTTSSHAGFYLGASVGPEGAAFSQRSHVVGQGNGALNFNVIATNHFSGTGVFGSLFGGYAWIHHQYYLAGELNGNISSLQYNLINDEYVHQNFAKTYFRMRHSEGVSVLPGIFLSETTLFYGRIGYSNGHLKIVEGADPSIQNFNRNLPGIRYGVGVRKHLSPRWSVMMDYSQINYRHVHSFTFDPNGMVAKNTNITPNTAQLGLGIIYRFDQPEVYDK